MNEVTWKELEEEGIDPDFQEWLDENNPNLALDPAESLKFYYESFVLKAQALQPWDESAFAPQGQKVMLGKSA